MAKTRGGATSPGAGQPGGASGLHSPQPSFPSSPPPEIAFPTEISSLRSDHAAMRSQLDELSALLRGLLGVPPPPPAGGGVFIKDEPPEEPPAQPHEVDPHAQRAPLPQDVGAFLERRGSTTRLAHQLCRAFRSAQPTATLSWAVIREEGLIPAHASGWEKFIPHGEFSAVDALLPWWVAREGRSLDKGSADRLWPILVDKPPDAATLLKSRRAPSTYCVTLEVFARMFMEAAAAIGPATMPLHRPQDWTPEGDWHTESSLVAQAVEGLSYHGSLSRVFQRGTWPKTLKHLFKTAAHLLRIDEEEVLIAASQSLGG